MKHSKLGFSLVELMVVVGIMGVLAAIAVPRFQNYQARARLTEAVNLLSQIHTLETTFLAEQARYTDTGGNVAYGASSAADANGNCARPQWALDIGFEITPCNPGVASAMPQFNYTIVTTNGGAGFTATATAANAGLLPAGCTITINENKLIARAAACP